MQKSQPFVTGLVVQKWENRLEELDLMCRKFAAGKLLEKANDWLEDAGEDPITEERFAERISVTGYNFENDGKITVFYDDGDIFWGHSIMVSVDKDGTACDAAIAG